MNTIKFINMYEPRTETHDVEIYDNKHIKINNKEYIVDSHSQIIIYPTIKCNADCDFCLNKFDKTLCKCKIELDRQQYLNKLINVFNILKPLNPYISICGGEPSLNKLTVDILKLSKEYNINHRIFATNGSGLLKRYDNKILLQHMKENGAVNNINISKSSFNNDDNFNIMKYNITNKELKTISTFCNINNMSARLSCLLHTKGVNDLKSILEYHNISSKLGFKSEIFREQIKTNKHNNIFVDIKPIIEDIHNNNDFKYIRTMQGHYYTVEIFKYKDNIVKCYKEKFKQDTKFIRDFVFLPNGHLYIANQYSNDLMIL